MPIYEYICSSEHGCERCRQGFDRLQRLSDAELTACPACGSAVARRISAPSVVAGSAHQSKESHIEKHGFTQYRRVGQGVYEKTAGKGPNYISDDG
jgi:putative FmdB family regulatory protein